MIFLFIFLRKTEIFETRAEKSVTVNIWIHDNFASGIDRLADNMLIGASIPEYYKKFNG